MTTMEIILMIEIIVLTILACMMLYLIVRDRDGNEHRRDNNQRTEYVWYPEPGQMPYYHGHPIHGYGEGAYFTYPQNAGQNRGRHFPPLYSEYINQYGYRYADDGSYNTVFDQNTAFSSPEVGSKRTYIKSGRTSGHYRKFSDNRNRNNEPQGRNTGFLRNRRRWRVDFEDMSSGYHVTRDFHDRLVVGRQMPEKMESGKLYLSMDATVSRSQFCLFVTNDGIMIENLSAVNITKKNGEPVWQPVRLEEGDILELGRMRYMVRKIRPVA